nr:unnamed protein product [Spirometra erinaceieuropaei]
MLIHDSGIHHGIDTPSTISASPSSAPTASNPTNATESDIGAHDLSRPHCPRTFTSHIGLVGHLRIHRAETGQPAPEAPTYSRRKRHKYPRTFSNRMDLIGNIRSLENQR